MSNQENVDNAAHESLRLLGADAVNWVAPNPGVDHDVAIIGGGQSGVTIAWALRRNGVPDVTVIEAAADQATAGSWLTVARMNTLRTPKTRPGPELGNPSIGFQAWYEGLHGKEAFAAIGRIARTDWADYLAWFQRQVGVTVRYGTELVDLVGTDEGHLQLHVRLPDGSVVVETARKVVFATGVEGSGGPYLPAVFDDLPVGRHAHTGHDIDFEALRGKSVGVLGAATSAFDAAAVALETGAADVHLFSYRSELKVAGPGGNTPNPGAQDNFHFQSDAARWKARWTAGNNGSSSPQDTVLRAVAFDNFYLHFDAPWKAAREEDGKVVVDAGDGTHTFDFVIAGTGYQYDPSTRHELKSVAPQIALWQDVYAPPAELQSEGAGATPYLGVGYELTEKHPGQAPFVPNIHLFNAAAAQSFGRPVGDIPSLRTGVPRLVAAISKDLYFADLARPKRAAKAAVPPAADPFAGQYAHAVWKPDVSGEFAD